LNSNRSNDDGTLGQVIVPLPPQVIKDLFEWISTNENLTTGSGWGFDGGAWLAARERERGGRAAQERTMMMTTTRREMSSTGKETIVVLSLWKASVSVSTMGGFKSALVRPRQKREGART